MATAEINTKYLEILFEHRIQEAIQSEQDRIIKLLAESVNADGWVEWQIDELIAAIKPNA